MNPGRELDFLVAEKVLGLNPKKLIVMNITRYIVEEFHDDWEDGLTRDSLPRYSTNISDAWSIVEKFDSGDKSIHVIKHGYTYGCELENRTYRGEPDTFWSGWVETAPYAICLALLKTKGIIPND